MAICGAGAAKADHVMTDDGSHDDLATPFAKSPLTAAASCNVNRHRGAALYMYGTLVIPVYTMLWHGCDRRKGHGEMPRGAPAWLCSHGSYKIVKGRSHTVEKRLNMHPHKPHATSQPSRLSHTYRPRTHSLPRLNLETVGLTVMHASSKPHVPEAAKQAGWTTGPGRAEQAKWLQFRKDLPDHDEFRFVPFAFATPGYVARRWRLRMYIYIYIYIYICLRKHGDCETARGYLR